MKPETKVVLAMERYARELLRWSRDEIHIFDDHCMGNKREELCEEFGADPEVVCEMEQELIDRRLDRSKKLCNW